MSEQRKLGKYELLDEIGRGGFATVYRARDTRLNRVVALKVLHPYRSAEPDFVERFRREAEVAANLDHPNIVPVYEADDADGQLYLAMKYVRGRILRELLQAEGALSLDRALPILEQVANALDYAHAQNVVHRDIKPSNIIVEDTAQGPRVTVLDFGLVKALEGSTQLTREGTLLGSPEYMAPEQADPNRANEIGPATDRYALGIVAYQMLAGRVPFPGETPATLNAQLAFMPPDPHALRSEVSSLVSAILLKMLAKAPADRYASAREFVAALRMAAAPPVSAPQVAVPRPAQSPIETVRKPEVITPVPPIPRKGRVWRMLLWLLAVLVIGIVCYKIVSELVKPPSPSISSFTASPSTLMLGECTTLSWQTTNVMTPIELERNGQTLQPKLDPFGSASDCPTATGEFVYNLIVTASSMQGPVSAEARVKVVPRTSLIDSFTANPSTLTLGQCTTLSWRTKDVVTPIELEVNKQTLQANLPISGSTSHCPTTTGEFVYLLTAAASSTQGPLSAEAHVNVVAPPTPPPQPTPVINSFTANPSTLALGECTTLSWQTTDAVTPIVLEVNGQTLKTTSSPSGSTSHCPTTVGEFIYYLTITASPTQGPVSATTPVNVKPKYDIGSTRTRTTDGMTMVYVPAGNFKMGSDTGVRDEKPIHDVTLDAFWIDRTEVTNAMFVKFVADIGYTTDAEKQGFGRAFDAAKKTWSDTQGANWQHPRGPTSNLAGIAAHPVVQISWNDASAYCKWAGGQLPTEAQWEYTARGSQNYTYPWGNTFDGTRLNFCDRNCPFDWADKTVNDGYADTAPVGSYPAGASWVGVLDLAGNVWEWVSDWYRSYPSSAETNPTGPTSGVVRVLRGGAWYDVADYVRTADRNPNAPDNRFGDVGFRCVVAPGE